MLCDLVIGQKEEAVGRQWPISWWHWQNANTSSPLAISRRKSLLQHFADNGVLRRLQQMVDRSAEMRFT
jgi:hypothetical protein